MIPEGIKCEQEKKHESDKKIVKNSFFWPENRMLKTILYLQRKGKNKGEEQDGSEKSTRYGQGWLDRLGA